MAALSSCHRYPRFSRALLHTPAAHPGDCRIFRCRGQGHTPCASAAPCPRDGIGIRLLLVGRHVVGINIRTQHEEADYFFGRFIDLAGPISPANHSE